MKKLRDEIVDRHEAEKSKFLFSEDDQIILSKLNLNEEKIEQNGEATGKHLTSLILLVCRDSKSGRKYRSGTERRAPKDEQGGKEKS